MIDDEPTLVIPRVSRRERRRDQHPRRLEALIGWFGYGLSVLALVTAAAWLAVRGDHTTPSPTKRPVTEAIVESRGIEPVSTPAPEEPTPAPAVPVSALATTSTAPPTTTTTVPVIAAAVTPTP